MLCEEVWQSLAVLPFSVLQGSVVPGLYFMKMRFGAGILFNRIIRK